MLKKRFRFFYQSKNGIDIKHFGLTFSQLCLLLSSTFLIFLILSAIIVGTATKIFHNFRIASLENDREKLQHELLSMKSQVAQLNQRLISLENTGDDLRTVANLPVIANDTRQVGVGGPAYFSGIDFLNYPDDISETAMEIRLDLDKLERSLQLEKASLTEIATKLHERQDYYDHFPSISPIVDGRISESFGNRIHPITNRPDYHKGIDIADRIGTKVLASAAGTVITVKRLYKPNVSYGKEIIIDHGNGYQTRYAHLSKILVREGQKVKRWDTIGEVGETGAATGPHLHYEVIKDREPIDPVNFILNTH